MKAPVLLWLRLKPKTERDREKLEQGLENLTAEDPTLRAKIDQARGEVVVGGMGELHLATVIDRLTR